MLLILVAQECSLLTPPQDLINFWPHPHGIVKVHLCVGTEELRER